MCFFKTKEGFFNYQVRDLIGNIYLIETNKIKETRFKLFNS